MPDEIKPEQTQQQPVQQQTQQTESPVAQQTQPVQQTFNAREYVARQYNNPELAKQFQSDEEVVSQLVDLARQTATYAQKAQLADRYAPHASEFDQWLAEKEKREAEVKSKEQKSWWEPPPFDPSWEKAIDPQTGLARPGFDPTIPQKLQAYRAFQMEKINQFTQNPMQLLEPGLKNTLVPMLKELLKEELGGYRQEQTANTYVQQNSNWLYEKDPNGFIKTSQDGSRVLSPAGRLFASYVEKAQKIGIRDVASQQEYAERCVEGDLWRAKFESMKTEGGKQEPRGGVNRIAALGNNAKKSAEEGEFPKGTSLKERLMTAVKENGISDDAFKTR